MTQTHTINLNSPEGNVFNLMAIMHDIMIENKFTQEQLTEFCNTCFKCRSYDEIVAKCKDQLSLINKVSVDQYEIIKTEEYQLM